MEYKVKKLNDKVVQFIAPSIYDVGKFMARIQAYYEDTDLKGRIFTAGIMHKLHSASKGAATTLGDVGGYNIPSSALKPFIKGLFLPHTPEEQEFINLFRFRTDKFYIIGLSEDDEDEALDHELCHALYFVSKEYKIEIDEVLKLYSTELSPLYTQLTKERYHHSVFFDEAQAYIIADPAWLKSTWNITLPSELETKLKNVHAKYSSLLKLEGN